MASFTVTCVGILACMALMSGSHSIPLPTDLIEDESQTIKAKHPCDNSSYLSLLHVLLHHIHDGIGRHSENHSNTTEGPESFLTNSTESPIISKRQRSLHNLIPLLVKHSMMQRHDLDHILVNTYSNNTPITIDKTAADGVSIQITTKIDFGGKPSLTGLQRMMGSRPLVVNNNIHFQVADTNKPKEKDDHYYTYNYNDDEDYYMFEGSGDHSTIHTTNTPALDAATTTEGDLSDLD